jgi:hypothetical protein
MIDSLLEREKKSITLNRCIVKDSNNEEILLMEKDEVLKAVKDHFMRISNTDNTPNANLEREWEEDYKPLDNISDNFFQEIMNPIQDDE